MARLTNGMLCVEIDPQGAELKSLRDKGGREYLWQADPRYWAKTSPVLFPIVGALKDDAYIFNGKEYRLSRHGFARDRLFEEYRISETEVAYTLRDSADTHSVYPFAFELTLRYALSRHTLSCTYEVYNLSDSQPLLFSVGGHPAFAVHTEDGGPAYTDHYLEFPDDEALYCHALEGNLVSGRVDAVPLNNNRLPLRYELFYRDALVIKTLRSRRISLRNTVNDRGLHFSYEHTPFFGIWAARDADFVCLEPWCGIADSVDHNQQLTDKEGIQRLDPGQKWSARWAVECF
ncbi:aldose 1-epimerase family protein [Parapedobacter deserti]|uniref:Aldose 1-epimerase family protein n=1 Tax=Parapedobacter deserti TaxID=1912957 RepID=A0ABV7JIW8_9SPHI